jgi:hypothetical protein
MMAVATTGLEWFWPSRPALPYYAATLTRNRSTDERNSAA